MCKTKGAPPGFNFSGRNRRSKYTLEEKKGIAKTKAKKRRDEETKYFNQIEHQLRSARSPYIGLPEKLVHNASLRLTNAWKISYHVLLQEQSCRNCEVQTYPKMSIIQDVSSDSILLVIHRPIDLRDAAVTQPFVILHASPSIQNYIHVSGCHDLIGAKFEDFCIRDDCNGTMYLELRAPLTQKDKRPYPAIRCRILRTGFKGEEALKFELGFFLLRAPLTAKKSSKGSCASIMKKHLNSTLSDQGSFEKHEPQYWRAMQARRRAIIRGASRDLVMPEQLKYSRSHSRGDPSEKTPLPSKRCCKPKEEPSTQLPREPINTRPHSPCRLPVSQPTTATCSSKPRQAEVCAEERTLSCGGAFTSNPCCSSSIELPPSPACCMPGYPTSNNSSSYRSVNSLQMSPILSNDDLLPENVQTDIDTAMRSLDAGSHTDDRPSEQDVICLDPSLNSIMPTIGLEAANGEGLNFNKSEINALQQMASEGDPNSLCPCGLTSRAECLDILESLKQEPDDYDYSPVPLVKTEVEDEKPATPSDFIQKLELFDAPETNGDVTFTADCEEDDYSRIRGFLVEGPLFSYCHPNTKGFNYHSPQSPQQPSCCQMKRSATSQQSLMDAQTSDEAMSLFTDLAAPRFIGDRSLPLEQFDLPEENVDLITELLDLTDNDTLCTSLTDASMPSFSGLHGITKKLSETSMLD